MTNKIAFFLAAVVLVALVCDQVLNDGIGTLFLARKFIDLLDAMALWR